MPEVLMRLATGTVLIRDSDADTDQCVLQAHTRFLFKEEQDADHKGSKKCIQHKAGLAVCVIIAAEYFGDGVQRAAQ